MSDPEKEKSTKRRVTHTTKVFGANMRRLRKASGLSLQEVGQLLGLTHQQVQKYESGQNRFPAERLPILREYYDVPYAVFFTGLETGGEQTDREWEMFVRLKGLKDSVLKDKIKQVLEILLG